MLDELVVVGYGVQRKSDVATSVASVKADEMKHFPPEMWLTCYVDVRQV